MIHPSEEVDAPREDLHSSDRSPWAPGSDWFLSNPHVISR